MINLIEKTKGEIASVIKRGVEKAGLAEFGAPIEIEKPRDEGHGDFSTNIAMRLAKPAKSNPRALAEKLIGEFETEGTVIESVETAGPGFINFTLKPERLYEVMKVIEDEGEDYGRVNIGGGKKTMVEFISSNPTGPMHVGNARGGAIGDCLASILDYAGYDVTREFYVNDAGNQIERFGMSLEARYYQLIGREVEFPEDGYHGEDITQLMRDYIAECGDADRDAPDLKEKLVAYGLEKNIRCIKDTMKDFGIDYDVWFLESDLHKSGEVKAAVKELIDKGWTYEKDGAIWLKSSEFYCTKDDEEAKDDVLVRSNGIPTYFAADIAYHRNKFVTRGFDTVIDVWGADHHGHTIRMKGAMDAIGIDPERLRFVLMQLVRLIRGGEVVKVSKRTGKAVTLNELLDDIGADAVRFFFNMRQPASHFDCDLDLAVSKTSDNPVYYVQYAHARMCSILKMLEAEGVSVPKFSEVNCALLDTAQEKALLKKLEEFPQEITDAALSYEPSKITRYAIDLASAFHTFYNADRVKVDDKELMRARLLLVNSARLALKSTLRVLGVTAPEKM